MTTLNSANRSYLDTLFDEDDCAEIERVRERWGWSEEQFYPHVAQWFSNFELMKDKGPRLALRILTNIQYITEEEFNQRINRFRTSLQPILKSTGFTMRDIILEVPDARGDSADKHAYEIIKSWGLEDGQTLSASQIKKLKRTERAKKILIFFNDTQGSGNQFLTRDLRAVPYKDFAAVFLVAVTFTKQALKRFAKELPREVRILNGFEAKSVDEFTNPEYRLIKQLGTIVYPKAPLGYGDCGLLTAYWFQCPNNSLPIIWADGTNNEDDGKQSNWHPLHPYRPKNKPPKVFKARPPAPVVDATLLTSGCPWNIDKEDLAKIEMQIARWDLVSPSFYERVGKWFGNFDEGDKKLALEVFLRMKHLNRIDILEYIERLRQTIWLDLIKHERDASDIVLVKTGSTKNSAYDYVGDFIDVWHLETDQVCTIERLTPDKALDKTLILFYHTRTSGKFFFQPDQEAKKSHAERLKGLSPRAVFIASYAMAPAAVKMFTKAYKKNSVLYLEELSEPISNIPDSLKPRLAEIEKKIMPSRPYDSENELLLAYYFQCPDVTSPLIWAELHGTDDRGKWSPLFPHRRLSA